MARVLTQTFNREQVSGKSSLGKTRNEKNVDILSFDGGGSRGIMELSILSDVMRLVTIILDDPTQLSYLLDDEDISKNPEVREKLVKQLSAVSNPRHPNEIYDMIVGTSTGALIAFGLVGGKSPIDDPYKRLPMTIDECMKMYKDNTRKIFTKSWSHWFLSAIPGLGSVPITTYSKNNVKEVLEDQFKDCCLAHFQDGKTVAGAVARQVGQNEELVLFDTKTDAYKLYKTYQVLQATSDAPVYFDTPVKIGDKEFVDGGVGGNCPLAQAIPRAKVIFEGQDKKVKVKITSALSIAPPSPEDTHIPDSLQVKYWLNYFVDMSTNGKAVYLDVKQRYKSTSFRRLAPRGKSLKHFKLDETDAEEMLKAMEVEKLTNGMFLVDVIATAAVVLNTYLGKTTDSPEDPRTDPSTDPLTDPLDATRKMGAKLSYEAGKIYKSRKEYGLAYGSYNTGKKLWMKLANPTEEISLGGITAIHDEIAEILKHLGRYQEAIDLYGKNVDHWRELSMDEHIEKSSFSLAQCLLLSSHNHEAEEELESVLELQRKRHGKNTANSDVARTLNHIGWCHREHGDYEMACKYYNDALDMRKELYGQKDNLDLAETLNSLGLAFSELGKSDEALTNVRSSLAMRERCLNGSDIEIAKSLNNLGCCLIGNEEYKTAQENLQMALNMKKAAKLDVNHPSIAITLENLAISLVLVDENKSGLALEYAQQALQMKKESLGDVSNPAIAKTLQIIGLCLDKAGNLKDSTKYIKASMHMTELTFHSDHPRLIHILSFLGQLLLAQEKYEEANLYLTKARNIEIRRNQDSDLQSSLVNLLGMSDKRLGKKKVGNYENKMLITSSLSYE